MIRLVGLLFALALLQPASGYPKCTASDAAQVSLVLARGIELNERFKRSAKAADDPTYQRLRKRNERYGEETAIPCAQKASELLDRSVDEALLHELVEFTLSMENSADERVSEVMASVFAKNPDAVTAALAKFSHSRAKVLLRTIASGWPTVNRTLEPAVRQEREAQLDAMRAATDPNPSPR
jgi:hypothetical protein